MSGSDFRMLSLTLFQNLGLSQEMNQTKTGKRLYDDHHITIITEEIPRFFFIPYYNLKILN